MENCRAFGVILYCIHVSEQIWSMFIFHNYAGERLYMHAWFNLLLKVNYQHELNQRKECSCRQRNVESVKNSLTHITKYYSTETE